MFLLCAVFVYIWVQTIVVGIYLTCLIEIIVFIVVIMIVLFSPFQLGELEE